MANMCQAFGELNCEVIEGLLAEEESYAEE